jgi:hypothetical protein
VIQLLNKNSGALQVLDQRANIGIVTNRLVDHPKDVDFYSRMLTRTVQFHLENVVLGKRMPLYFLSEAEYCLEAYGGLGMLTSDIIDSEGAAIICKGRAPEKFPVANTPWDLLHFSYISFVNRILLLLRLDSIGKNIGINEIVDYVNGFGVVSAVNPCQNDEDDLPLFEFTTPLGSKHRCSVYYSGMAMSFTQIDDGYGDARQKNWDLVPLFSSFRPE